MHWTESLKTALNGGKGKQALHFLHQFQKPLVVGETTQGSSTACASEGHLRGGGPIVLSESVIWLTSFKNKKTLPEMAAFCYIHQSKTHAILQEEKYPVAFENRKLMWI